MGSNTEGEGVRCKWLLTETDCTILTTGLPDVETLHDMYQYTKFDSDALCRQETLRKRETHKRRLRKDAKAGHLKSQCGAVKDESPPPLSWACDVVTSPASMCRQTKGQPCLRCEDASSFWAGRNADFASCTVKIVQVQGHCVFVEAEGRLPVSGLLSQGRSASNADELHILIENYWTGSPGASGKRPRAARAPSSAPR